MSIVILDLDVVIADARHSCGGSFVRETSDQVYAALVRSQNRAVDRAMRDGIDEVVELSPSELSDAADTLAGGR